MQISRKIGQSAAHSGSTASLNEEKKEDEEGEGESEKKGEEERRKLSGGGKSLGVFNSKCFVLR